MSRDVFKSKQASEKNVLVQIEATSRLFTWSIVSGTQYSRVTDYFVTELHKNDTPLSRVATLGAVTNNTFYYDIPTSTLYTDIGSDPSVEQMVVTYKFFYSTGGLSASWDLTDTGLHVNYDGRVIESPGYKHKVGIEQALISIVGSGTLQLENGDGGLDEIFDTLFFENQFCTIYSWSRELNFSDAKKIYKGRVTNKTYDSEKASFTIKDTLFDLEQNVPQDAYTDDDTVNDNIKGRYKRWAYGRVDGLMLQSLDQTGDGYTATGTVSAGVDVPTLTGVGTLFLSEVSPGDNITIGTQEFGVESIQSDTELTLNDSPTYSFTGQPGLISPEIPVIFKNREFLVTGHACAELTKTVINVTQFNRVVLNNTTGIESGDFLEFATLERVEVKNVAPGNIVVLRQNLIDIPAVSSTVTRQPVQKVYFEGRSINSDDFTVSNAVGSCKVTLDSDVEFNLAPNESLNVDLSFTNGSRDVTYSGDLNLTDIVKPRDFIRPSDLTYTTYFEILSVSEASIELRVAFSDPTHSGPAEGKKPSYIGDSSVLSSDVIGRTADGTPTGEWLKTGPDVVKDLLSHIGITDLDLSSFSESDLISDKTVSYTIPKSPTGSAVKTKTVIDDINRSMFGAITLNNDLQIKYILLDNRTPTDVVTIFDRDVIKWKIKTTNGKTFRNSLVRYKHKDVDRVTLESGSNAVNFSSTFVERYIGTNKTEELDVYLYDDSDANIMAQRLVYFNRLGRSDIEVITDLRLEDIEIGDRVVLDLDRLYKRFGDSTTRKKIAVVVGKKLTGERTTLQLTDLGNTFNTSAKITENTAVDYTTSDADARITNGYITDANCIVDNDENTANVNLIS